MNVTKGGIGWSGVCGVPGLGCSVKNKYSYVPALQLWEDHSHHSHHSPHSHLGINQSKKDNIQAAGQSQNLGEKIVSLLGLKRRNTMKVPESRVVSLPKVSVRRSVSSVSPKLKSGPIPCGRVTGAASSDSPDPTSSPSSPSSPSSLSQSSSCQNCVVGRRGPPVRRTVSYHHKKESPGDQSLSSQHRRLQKEKVGLVAACTASTNTETCLSQKTICQSRATQTEADHYDYAYSTTPARQRLTDDADGGNIYEEIIPPHRRLFFSISQGRRDHLSLYKFADWDLEDKLKPKTDQDNYIKPREIKSSLSKKSSLRKIKTKEQRVVTFAGEESGRTERMLQRSASLHVS